MKYRVTVTRSDVYAVDASTLIGAEQVALRAAREGLPPDYSMDAEASAVFIPSILPERPAGTTVGEATAIRKAERGDS